MASAFATTLIGQSTVLPVTTEFVKGDSLLPDRFSSDSTPCGAPIVGKELGSTSGIAVTAFRRSSAVRGCDSIPCRLLRGRPAVANCLVTVRVCSEWAGD